MYQSSVVQFGTHQNHSESTVKRWRKAMGLHSSRVMAKEMAPAQLEEAVLSAMSNDPRQHHGPQTIKNELAHAGLHVAWRVTISLTMIFVIVLSNSICDALCS
jgi:hypothetical protein